MTPPPVDPFAAAGIEDPDVFALSAEARERLMLELGDHQWTGLATRSALRVVAGEHSVIPLLVAMQDTASHMHAASWKAVARLVAVDLHSGEARTSPIPQRAASAKRDKRPRPSKGRSDPPSGAMADAVIRNCYSLDLAKLFGGLTPGQRLAATAIAADHRSEPTLVEVTGQGTEPAAAPPMLDAEEAQAVVSKLEENRQSSPIRPDFDQPPAGEEPGIHLSMPSEWQPGNPPPRIRGGFRVAAGARQVVAPEARASSARLPAAFARALLVVTDPEQSAVRAIPLETGLRSADPIQPGDLIGTGFEVELHEVLRRHPEPGTYHAQLIAGPLATGPATLHVRS